MEGLYPTGASIAVKKPYLGRPGCVSVDNPGNVDVLTSFPDTIYSLLSKNDSSQLRALGNKHFKQHQFVTALELYQHSAHKANTFEEKFSALGNLSECHLQLRRFHSAYTAANQALSLRDAASSAGYVRMLSRKGRALHGMIMYREAAAAYKLALANCAKEHRKDILDLLEQTEQGDITSKIHSYLSQGCETGEAPKFLDYIGPVQIRRHPGSSHNGIFATRAIERGEIVLVSNAVCYVPGSDRVVADTENLFVEALRAAARCPRTLKQINALWDKVFTDNASVPRMELFKPDGEINWDENIPLTTTKVSDLCNFAMNREGYQDGLWILPGFINRSCVPNLCASQIGSARIYRAQSRIKSGDELTYCRSTSNMLLPFSIRHKCNCDRCCYDAGQTFAVPELAELGNKVSGLFQRFVRDGVIDLEMEQGFLESAISLERLLRTWGGKMEILRTDYALCYLFYYLYEPSFPRELTSMMPSYGEFCLSLAEVLGGAASFLQLLGGCRISGGDDLGCLERCLKIRYGKMSRTAEKKFRSWLMSDKIFGIQHY